MPRIDPELRAEFKAIVEEVIEAELQQFALAFVDLLRPMVDAVHEIDRSCKLLIDGQAMFEKWLAAQQPERESWESDDDESE